MPAQTPARMNRNWVALLHRSITYIKPPNSIKPFNLVQELSRIIAAWTRYECISTRRVILLTSKPLGSILRLYDNVRLQVLFACCRSQGRRDLKCRGVAGRLVYTIHYISSIDSAASSPCAIMLDVEYISCITKISCLQILAKAWWQFLYLVSLPPLIENSFSQNWEMRFGNCLEKVFRRTVRG